MEYDTIVIGALIVLLLYFSLDFDKHYSPMFHNASRHPFMRFIAGIVLILTAEYNPQLSAILLLIIFFWIADIHLLSTLNLQQKLHSQ
jgi:hypothetical protein